MYFVPANNCIVSLLTDGTVRARSLGHRKQHVITRWPVHAAYEMGSRTRRPDREARQAWTLVFQCLARVSMTCVGSQLHNFQQKPVHKRMKYRASYRTLQKNHILMLWSVSLALDQALFAASQPGRLFLCIRKRRWRLAPLCWRPC